MTQEELILKIGGDSSGAQAALKAAGESFGSLFSTITGGVAVGELLSKAIEHVADTLKELPGEFIELAKEGSKILDVEQAFDRLSGGAAAAATTLAGLREGTKGTVDDFELMKVANKAMSDGLHLSSDDFKLLAEGARLLAKQTGGETKDAFETLNQAMETGRTRALNQIGVHIELDVAMARYAASIGKTSEELSNHEKIAATSAEVLRQLRDRVSDAGDQQLTFKEKVDQAAARLTNWKDEVAKAVATSPAMNGAMDVINKAIDAAFGKGQQASVQAMAQLIATTAVASVQASSIIVEGVREIASAYESARGAVDQLFKAYNDKAIADVEAKLETMREVAATSTSVTSASKLRVQELEIELARLKGASQGYQDDSNAAAQSQDRLNALTEKAQGFLQDLAAQFAKTGPAAKQAGDASAGAGRQMADAFELPSKSAEKLAEMWRKTHEEWTREANKFVLDSIKATEAANQKEAEMRAKAQTDQLQLMNGFHDKVADMNLSGADLAITQIERERDAKIDALEKVARLSGLTDAQGLADIQAYYQRQIDLVNGTADTIEQRLRAQGVATAGDLQRQAEAATRDYEQMLKSGLYTTDELQAAWRRMVTANVAASHDWKAAFENTVSDIAISFAKALEAGGGFAAVALQGAHLLGEDMGRKLMQPMVDDLAQEGKGKLADTLGQLAGPLGGAAVTLGVDLAKKLWNSVFGTAGRDAVVTFANSLGGFDALHAKLSALGNDGEQLWVKLTQGVGRNDPAAAKTLIDQITSALDKQKQAEDDLLASQNKQIGDLAGQLKGLGAGALLQPYLDKLATAKGLTSDNLDLMRQLASDGAADWHHIQDAVQRYGGDVSKLGGTFQAQRLHDGWQQLVDDMGLFQRGGISAGDALNLTKSKIQDLVTQSISFGVEIPNNAKPWIQSLIDQGQLLDENGKKITDTSKLKFSGDLTDSVQALVDKIGILIDKLSQGVPDAIAKIPPKITTTVDFHGQRSGDWPDNSGSDAPGAATGALVTAHGLEPLRMALGGLVNFTPRWPDIIPAMLAPGEIVLNAAQQHNVANAITDRGAGQPIIVEVHHQTVLGGEVVDQRVERVGAKALNRGRWQVGTRTVKQRTY